MANGVYRKCCKVAAVDYRAKNVFQFISIGFLTNIDIDFVSNLILPFKQWCSKLHIFLSNIYLNVISLFNVNEFIFMPLHGWITFVET